MGNSFLVLDEGRLRGYKLKHKKLDQNVVHRKGKWVWQAGPT